MTDMLTAIQTQGVFPVIEIEDAAGAVPLAEALRAGGINAIEITLRTDAAYQVIRTIAERFPDMLVGAGTVLARSQVDAALDAGARFMVAPGFNPAVVSYCSERQVLMIPGVDNASGVELAVEMGLAAVKYFPAQYRGGISALKSLANPFKNRMKYIPLGGISLGHLPDYARFPQVLAVGGTWIARQELIERGDFAAIRHNAQQAVAHLHGFAIGRLSLAAEDPGGLADSLSRFFNPIRSAGGARQWAALTAGRSGQIEIACNSVERASLRLAADGILSDPDSAVYQHDLLTSICLRDAVAGYQVKLTLRED